MGSNMCTVFSSMLMFCAKFYIYLSLCTIPTSEAQRLDGFSYNTEGVQSFQITNIAVVGGLIALSLGISLACLVCRTKCCCEQRPSVIHTGIYSRNHLREAIQPFSTLGPFVHGYGRGRGRGRILSQGQSQDQVHPSHFVSTINCLQPYYLPEIDPPPPYHIAIHLPQVPKYQKEESVVLFSHESSAANQSNCTNPSVSDQSFHFGEKV